MAESKPARATKPPVESGYTVLCSPDGHETTVPDSIKDLLIQSGYTEK